VAHPVPAGVLNQHVPLTTFSGYYVAGMQHRMTRLVILCVLLGSGAASGFAVWTIERNDRQREEQREAKDSTIERLLSSLAVIATAQQAYADFARRDMASFTQVALHVDRLTTDAAGLRPASQSGATSERLEEFWTALSALMGAESRARELFAGGDENAAADIILASAREHVATLNATAVIIDGQRQANPLLLNANGDFSI